MKFYTPANFSFIGNKDVIVFMLICLVCWFLLSCVVSSISGLVFGFDMYLTNTVIVWFLIALYTPKTL